MKNQKGFIVPLLLVVIAFLLLGGGAYIFTQNKEASPVVSGNVELPQATSTEQTTTVQTVSFTASPTSGSVPLTVYFSSNWFGNMSPQGLSINYGDGETDYLCNPGELCPRQIAHIYKKAGTFTTTLMSGPVGSQGKTVGSMAVTVTDTKSISFTASPTSGSAPLNIMFNYNAAYGTGTVQYWVDFGDGQAPQDMAYGCDLDTKTPCVKGWNYSRIYTSAGTYTARLYTSAGNIGTAVVTVR